MKIWGITGLIGSGKSTAVKYLAEKGFPTIDADQVSRLVVDRNTDLGRVGFEKIFKVFGNEVLDNLGNLDRAKLRKRIVLNPHEREILEAILHPLITDSIQNEMRKWKEQGIRLGFVEGARLIESKFHQLLAGVILVTSAMDQRIKRVSKRDGMDKREVQQILDLQDERLMRSHCKVTWKNDKTLKDFHKQIDEFVNQNLGGSTGS